MPFRVSRKIVVKTTVQNPVTNLNDVFFFLLLLFFFFTVSLYEENEHGVFTSPAHQGKKKKPRTSPPEEFSQDSMVKLHD